LISAKFGEVAEWLKAHAWKVCLGLNLTRVRIPLSPPIYEKLDYNGLAFFVLKHCVYWLSGILLISPAKSVLVNSTVSYG
jgi:hypothetical protein